MRGLNALSGQGASKPVFPERLEVGKVAVAVEAGGNLMVTLESLPEQLTGPIKGWQARSTAVVKGDRCLVASVSDGDYWFVTWDIPGWS